LRIGKDDQEKLGDPWWEIGLGYADVPLTTKGNMLVVKNWQVPALYSSLERLFYFIRR
jgi:hypothetical protein